MKKALLEVLFKSEKRKDILLFLKEGGKEMETILESLGTKRQALLPQIRILEDHFLVKRSGDVYELTIVGKMIVEEMVPLIDTCELFDEDVDYWGTHSFDFIPSHLLKRINELGKCRIVNPPLTEIHEADNKVHENSKKSESIYGVTTFFHPNYTTLFSELIQNNVSIYMIISKELLDKQLTDNYDDITKILSEESVHFFVYPGKMDFVGFSLF